MTPEEQSLVAALARMCAQYIADKDGTLDHGCMVAGEEAIALLHKYGFVDSDDRGAAWTEAGRALLNSN